ncbi:hypothetical protein D3C86_1610310 [compost metagenome]
MHCQAAMLYQSYATFLTFEVCTEQQQRSSPLSFQSPAWRTMWALCLCETGEARKAGILLSLQITLDPSHLRRRLSHICQTAQTLCSPARVLRTQSAGLRLPPGSAVDATSPPKRAHAANGNPAVLRCRAMMLMQPPSSAISRRFSLSHVRCRVCALTQLNRVSTPAPVLVVMRMPSSSLSQSM